jgi:hypothetical protein
MRMSLVTMRDKIARNDARGIAQMIRLGWFRAVHGKNVETQKMRRLLSNRKVLKRKLVDIDTSEVCSEPMDYQSVPPAAAATGNGFANCLNAQTLYSSTMIDAIRDGAARDL